MVSIIIPCFNSEKTIRKTINSIINQTYNEWEALITDDCSTDNSWKILNNLSKKDKRIKIFKLHSNSGVAVARNNSISKASGRYIAFLDSDDLWHKDKLTYQISFMKKNNIFFSYSSYVIINENDELLYVKKPPKKVNYLKMLKNNYIGCLTAIYDTKFYGKFYFENFRKRQDYMLWLSILTKVDYAYCTVSSIPLAYYRVQNNSLSSRKFLLLKDNYNVYRKFLKFNIFKSFIFLIRNLFYSFLYKRNIH